MHTHATDVKITNAELKAEGGCVDLNAAVIRHKLHACTYLWVVYIDVVTGLLDLRSWDWGTY